MIRDIVAYVDDRPLSARLVVPVWVWVPGRDGRQFTDCTLGNPSGLVKYQ